MSCIRYLAGRFIYDRHVFRHRNTPWTWLQCGSFVRSDSNFQPKLDDSLNDDPDTFGTYRGKNRCRAKDDFKQKILAPERGDALTKSMHQEVERQPRQRFSTNEDLIRASEDVDLFGTLGSKALPHVEVEPENDIQRKENDRLELRTGEKRKRIQDYIIDIHNLARQKRLKEALDVYDHILKMNVRSDSNLLFVVVISYCGKVGYTRKAFSVYKQMRDRGFKPTPGTLTGLFNSCAECPFPKLGLEKARKLRDKMNIEGWKANPITYQAMIKAFGKLGDLGTAFELVDEMQRLRHPITTGTFNFLLISCNSDKEAGFAHTMKVLRKMERMRIRPDLFSFNLILRATRDCGIGPPEVSTQLLQDFMRQFNKPNLLRSKKEEELKLLHLASGQEMKSNLPQILQIKPPDVSTDVVGTSPIVNELLDLASNATREITAMKPEFEYARNRLALLGGPSGFLSKMRSLRVKPSIKTFTILLIAQEPTTANELALIKEMEASYVKPDIDFFNVLIKHRCSTNRYPEARNVLDLIISHNLQPDIATFGTLAMTCWCTAFAKSFLRDMESANFRPNLNIMGSMASTAKINMNFDMALYVIKKTSLLGIAPDEKFLEDLELLRKRGREDILKEERDLFKEKPTYFHENFKKEYEEFCKVYRSWLKNTEVEKTEHPWKQYRS